MKTIIDKANTRGYFNHGWLKTYHTFSFADYYNPRRIHFGALRVLNDDTVAPGEGFGMHPHKNMEVVSIPLQGYLRHGDNVQNESTITPGEIQVMSTGTGIYHSEYNASKTEDLKFLQIWVIPNVEETKPEYHNYNIRPLLKRNELATFISPSGNTPAHLLQDTWFSIGTFDAGHSVIYRMHKPRTGVYIFVIEGEINVAGENLSRRDGIGIWDTDVLLPKEQILEAVDAIRKGNAVMSFPYDGRFYMLPQEDSMLLKKREMNMEECCQKIYEYVLAHGPNSVGGAFLVNKNVYIKYGGENQHFYGWGPEDAERCKRMEILGLPIYRAQGPLLHLFHPRMQNSWFGNQRLEYANRMEFIRVAGMTRSQLLQYISGWSIGI